MDLCYSYNTVVSAIYRILVLYDVMARGPQRIPNEKEDEFESGSVPEDSHW